MRLIVTHEQPDFDAVASLALAKVLFPGSQATVQGATSRSMQEFLTLYRDVLDLLDEDEIDLDGIAELVVVDTADPSRIRPFDQLLGRVPVTLYDHHPLPRVPVPAGRGIVETVGATATLLTRELAAVKTPIPAEVASLGLLGIHEDTGNLSYDGTTPDDYRAAAYLLAQGGNLQLVRRFARDVLTPEQLDFRTHLHRETEVREVAGRAVLVAAFEHPTYVPGVSGLVSELLDMHGADAALVAVGMEGRTLVFARSNERFDSAAALADAVGGSGHPGAAYGKTDIPPEEAARRAVEALARHASPLLTAADVMTTPVRTVPDHATVAEVQAGLLVHGHNGMPVVDASGRVTGVISRRDIDRALRHGLGSSRVSGFMSRSVVAAPPTATIPELEELILDHGVGRIPVVEDGKLVGIVTRADLIQARHSRDHADEAQSLLGRLPPRARSVIEAAQELAGDQPVYLVGGTVRDLMLGAGSKDVDLVVEGGSVQRFGSKLQRKLGGELSCHADFATCTLRLEDELVVDLAAAREETYSHPGALPEVSPSSVKHDLARRDFTINAMAVRVQPGPPVVLDPFGGRADLQRRQLRLLHPLSFVEDATRILRGARLAGRLSFEFAADSAAKARAVVAEGLSEGVSRSRLRAELELIFAEQRVAPALSVLDDMGVLEPMFGLKNDADGVRALDAERATNGDVPDEAYLLVLLMGQTDSAATEHVQDFNWPRRVLVARDRLLRMLADHEDVTDTDLEQLSDAEAAVLSAMSEPLRERIVRLAEKPPSRRLRGRDVVALGLPEGPAIGRVLAEVERARATHKTSTFEEELELARRLVDHMRREDRHGAP